MVPLTQDPIGSSSSSLIPITKQLNWANTSREIPVIYVKLKKSQKASSFHIMASQSKASLLVLQRSLNRRTVRDPFKLTRKVNVSTQMTLSGVTRRRGFPSAFIIDTSQTISNSTLVTTSTIFNKNATNSSNDSSNNSTVFNRWSYIRCVE